MQNTITKDVSAPDAIAFDASDNLYVANLTGGAKHTGSVTVYPPGDTTPSKPTILTSCPTAISISKFGDIYVASNCNNTVTIYDGSTRKLEQTLGAPQIENPQGLDLDSNAVLYVANADSATYPTGDVAVCAGSPPNKLCKKKIIGSGKTPVVDNPQALRVYTTDYLFVANDDGAKSTVSRFKPYTDGNKFVDAWGMGDVNDPNELRFDSSGHLCASSGGNNSVYCFVSANVVFREVTNGVESPTGLTFDSFGNLYVANFKTTTYKGGTWTKYCAKKTCTKPVITKHQDVNGPVAIGVAP